MGKPEAKIEDYLVQQVKATGGEVRKTKWIGRDGCPDRFCWWPGGLTAWCETKRSGAEVDWDSPQGREIRKMHQDGLNVFVANTRDKIDDMIENVLGTETMFGRYR